MIIPGYEFQELLDHLMKHPIPINQYRNKAGAGRSQTFGVVGRRCLPPDYSRMNWLRPYTYKLLCDFAAKHVTIPWNAITVNEDYQALPHYDRHNVGYSFLVAFGPYKGGELEIHEGPLKGVHNIKHDSIMCNFSTVLHSVRPFEGKRFSLVFYMYDLKGKELPPASVKEENGEYYFYRGDDKILRNVGLPHPLRKLQIG